MLIGYDRDAAETGLVQNGNQEGLLAHVGEAPVAIIAPTGSGKGRDFIVPNILHHKGPVSAAWAGCSRFLTVANRPASNVERLF